MNLQRATCVAESWPGAKIHHAAEAAASRLTGDRVYTGRRKKFALRWQGDIESRKTEGAAARFAVYDPAAESVAAAQKSSCAVQIAVRDGASDRAGRNGLPIEGHGLDDLDIEAPLPPQSAKETHVSLAPSPEPVIVPNQEFTHAALPQ